MTEERVIGRGYLLVDRWADGSAVAVNRVGGPVYESVVDAYNALLRYNTSPLHVLEIMEVELTNLGRWSEIEKEGEKGREEAGRVSPGDGRSL